MLELRITEQGRELPLFDLPALLGRAGAAERVGDTIDALIAFMDDLGSDPDLEDDGDTEPSGDEADASFPEWRAFDADRPVMKRGFAWTMSEEDAEDDDPAGGNITDEPHDDDDPAGGNGAEDDFDLPYYAHDRASGPGCVISDNDTEHDGSEDGGDTELNGDELDGSADPHA